MEMSIKGPVYKEMNRDKERREEKRARRCLGHPEDIFEDLQQVRPGSIQVVGKESLWLSLRKSLCQTMGWEPPL